MATIETIAKQYSNEIIQYLELKISYEELYRKIETIYSKIENLKYENGNNISDETQNKIWNEIENNINIYEIKKGLYEQENKTTLSIISSIRKTKKRKKK